MATFVPLLSIPIQLQDSTTSVNMSAGSLEFFLAGTSTPTNMFSNSSGTSIGTSITLNAGGFPESGGNVITLFMDSSISYKIVGKDATAATIFTSDNIDSSLAILSSVANSKGASLVGVEDSGAFFGGATVEAVLADIGANYLKDDRASTITAVYTFGSGGKLAMADEVLERPEIKDFSITHSALTQTTATVDIDLSTANSFDFLLTENATITLSNSPPTGKYGQCRIRITQDGAGGAYTVTWPAGVDWPGAAAPTMSTGNDTVDVFNLETDDAGITWLGSFLQAYG